MEQVDVTGGRGPLGSAAQHYMGAARPPKWPCHVTDPWELLQSQSQASIQGGLINEQDLFTVDPWAHCYRLGSLHQLTNRPTIRISPCVVQVTTNGSQPSPLDQEAVERRVGRRPLAPPGALGPPPTSWLPTSTPHASLHYK